MRPGGVSMRGSVPASRVLEVYERWQRWDPEENIDENAASRSGLSLKWFYRLRDEGPDRLVSAQAVDLLLTGLELQYEWPFIEGLDPPEELAERWCRRCKQNALATFPDHHCIWCGGATLRPKPLGYKPTRSFALRAITEERLEEAWSWYQQGYSLRQVVDIMWHRMSYATKPTAMGAIRRAWKDRGKSLRSVAELNRARCTTHGRASMVRKGEPGFEEYAAYCHDQHMAWYYEGREKCAEDGCEKYALRNAVRKREGRNVIDSDYCRWHTPGESDRAASWLITARRQGEVPLSTIRPVLDAWKITEHGMRDLSAATGINRGTLTRWAYRWADDKLVKRELVEKVQTVGLPLA